MKYLKPIFPAGCLMDVLFYPVVIPLSGITEEGECDIVAGREAGEIGRQDGRYMKVAITSYDKDLLGKVDLSFGRTKWFVVVDTESGAVEAHSNKQNYNAAQGAGIQAAQNISNLEVDVVLTGNVGPNAFKALRAAAIKIFIIGKDIETAGDAFSLWKAGNLREVHDATIEGHWV